VCSFRLIGCCLTAGLIKFNVGLKVFGLEEEAIFGRKLHDIGSVSENSIVRKFQYHSSRSGSNVSQLTQSNPSTSIPRSDLITSTPPLPAQEGEGATDAEANYEKSESFHSTNEGENIEDDDECVANGSTIEASSSARKKVSFGNGNIFSRKESTDGWDDFTAAASLQETIEQHLGPRKSFGEGYLRELIIRTFPIWGVVLVLILTRVDQIGIKPWLNLKEPYFQIVFGTYGIFRVSVSVVFQLLNILSYPNLNWKFEFFYLPFMMPFVLISVVTMIIYARDMKSSPFQVASTVASRLYNPAFALMGALTLVQLMIRSGNAAPSYILGTVLADWFQEGFM
jgi:hypothetical protein